MTKPPSEVRAHLERAAAGTSPLAELLLAAWAKFPGGRARRRDRADAARARRDHRLGCDRRSVAPRRARADARSASLRRVHALARGSAMARERCAAVLSTAVRAARGDRGSPELTRARKSADRAIKGLSMRAWLTERIGRVRDALRERYPDGVPVLPAAEAKLARRAGKLAAAEPAHGRSERTAERRLAEIRANPHDDALRQVYGSARRAPATSPSWGSRDQPPLLRRRIRLMSRIIVGAECRSSS